MSTLLRLENENTVGDDDDDDDDEEEDNVENPLLLISFFLFFELGRLSVTILAEIRSSTDVITRKIRGTQLILSVCFTISAFLIL